jgi:hypothetical protein
LLTQRAEISHLLSSRQPLLFILKLNILLPLESLLGIHKVRLIQPSNNWSLSRLLLSSQCSLCNPSPISSECPRTNSPRSQVLSLLLILIAEGRLRRVNDVLCIGIEKCIKIGLIILHGLKALHRARSHRCRSVIRIRSTTQIINRSDAHALLRSKTSNKIIHSIGIRLPRLLLSLLSAPEDIRIALRHPRGRSK